jgi:hypothetical protein
VTPVLLDVNIAAASVVLFAAAYAVAVVATRPLPVPPDEATPDLGDEPPAVVNLLANRWKLTADAAEATLLDLVARGYLELRQAGADPAHTTIHLTGRAEDADLLPYERRVLHRAQDMATDGVVPVGALAFRNRARGRRWRTRLRKEVAADARARGLSRRRFGDATYFLLFVVMVASSGGLGVVALRGVGRVVEDWQPAVSAGAAAILAVFTAQAVTVGYTDGERDTSAGQIVAARWLGVQRWLRAHEEFADLPPAAVTVWDRYLAYGSALGVTHTTSEVLDLGLGDRRTVWSSYGGNWRRVRVHFPRLRLHYGRPAPHLAARGAVAVLAGAVALQFFAPPLSAIAAMDEDAAGGWLRWSVTPLALATLAYGGYVLVRTAVAHAITQTVTGEVLWTEVAQESDLGEGRRVVTLTHVVIDDGTRDRASAWALPGGIARVQDRDVATIRAVPWTRRVVSLTVLRQGRPGGLRDAPAPAPSDDPVTDDDRPGPP